MSPCSFFFRAKRNLCQRLRVELNVGNLGFGASTAVLGQLDWKKRFSQRTNCYLFRKYEHYFFYRITVFIIMLASFIYSIIDWEISTDTFSSYFHFLTHWGLALEVIYLGFISYVTYALEHTNGHEVSFPWYVQVTWFLRAIVLPASILISVMYWSFRPSDDVLRFSSLLVHGLNSVIMVSDAWVTNIPYMLLHGLWFLLFCVVYLGWSLLHYALGLRNHMDRGNYLYPQLDWSNRVTISAMIFLGACVGVPLINCTIWACLAEPTENSDEKLPNDGNFTAVQISQLESREADEDIVVTLVNQSKL